MASSHSQCPFHLFLIAFLVPCMNSLLCYVSGALLKYMSQLLVIVAIKVPENAFYFLNVTSSGADLE